MKHLILMAILIVGVIPPSNPPKALGGSSAHGEIRQVDVVDGTCESRLLIVESFWCGVNESVVFAVEDGDGLIFENVYSLGDAPPGGENCRMFVEAVAVDMSRQPIVIALGELDRVDVRDDGCEIVPPPSPPHRNGGGTEPPPELPGPPDDDLPLVDDWCPLPWLCGIRIR